jgi:hypothetical protein
MRLISKHSILQDMLNIIIIQYEQHNIYSILCPQIHNFSVALYVGPSFFYEMKNSELCQYFRWNRPSAANTILTILIFIRLYTMAVNQDKRGGEDLLDNVIFILRSFAYNRSVLYVSIFTFFSDSDHNFIIKWIHDDPI